MGAFVALGRFLALGALVAAIAIGAFAVLARVAGVTTFAGFTRLTGVAGLVALATVAPFATGTLAVVGGFGTFGPLSTFRALAAAIALVAPTVAAFAVAALAATVAAFTPTRAVAGVAGGAIATIVGRTLRCFGGLGTVGGAPAEQVQDAIKQATVSGRSGRCRGCGGRCSRTGGRRCRRLVAGDALDHGLLAVAGLLELVGEVGVFLVVGLGHGVAGTVGQQTLVVVLEALQAVERGLDRLVGDQHDLDLEACFQRGDLGALLVEQVGGDLHRHLHVHGGGVLLHGLFLQHAQHVQGRGLDVADDAGAVAARAGDVGAFVERRTQPLARQLHQAEAGDLAGLHAGTVQAERFFQALLDLALVAAALHVDEVDDDEAAQVAQSHLAGHFLGRLHVGSEGRFLDVGATGGASRVHVDGHQRLGVVDDDGATRGQRHDARVGGLDLVLDLEAREQRGGIAVVLDACHVVGHHVAHELRGLLVDVLGVDQHLADVGREVVTDGADDQAGFLVDEEGARCRLGGRFDRLPQLQQVVQVPLQLLDRATDAGGAGDEAHAGGHLQLVHGLAQFLPVLALDAARHAAATGVVGHEDHVAAGQRDHRGQGGALVAAFFLLDLDDEFLAFADHVLDAQRLAAFDILTEVGSGDFLEGQEAVTVFAVVDEAGFQRGFDTSDDPFVDIALATLASGGLDVNVDQPLAIDDGNPQFFRMGCVEQHAFHAMTPCTRWRGV